MFELSGISENVFNDRYVRFEGETWVQASKRVADHVASVEDSGQLEWYNSFYKEIVNNRFMPGGRIWYGSGRPKAQLLNCFVIDTEDSREGWGQTLKEHVIIAGTGGGLGINFSPIRPRGSSIKGIGGKATGAVSLMKIVNGTGSELCANSRRTALMFCLNLTHPDIPEFLDSKLNKSELNFANISVVLNIPADEFRRKIDNQEEIEFEFGGRKAGTRIRADLLFQRLVENAQKSGEPGVLNGHLANQMSNIFYHAPLISTNPSLAAGTLVGTKLGIFPIEKLEGKNFQVKSLDGQWADAKCWLSGENEPVYEIKLGNYRTIRATAQHRWPVLGRMGEIKKAYTTELVPGDLIPLNRNETTGIEGDMTLTEGDGFLAGYMLGDGWLVKRGPGALASDYVGGITFSKDERALAELVLAEVNSRKVNVSNLSEREHEIYFQWTDRLFSEHLLGIGVVEDKGLGLPEKIWTSNDNYIRGFVDGLLSSDGCVSKSNYSHPYISLVTSRRKLAEDFSKLLSFYGITTNIFHKTATSTFPNGKDYNRTYESWQVRLSTGSVFKFARIFTISHPKKKARLEEILKKGFDLGREQEYIRVESVKLVGSEAVWDISVNHNQHLFPINYCYTGNCGEIWLEKYGCCDLGALVLPRFVKKGGMDWTQLESTVRTSVRFLDNVLSVNQFPFAAIKENCERVRRIGLGVMGLHNMLLSLGLKYSSPESFHFVDTLFAFIKDVAYNASIDLALEKGSFPAFDSRMMESGFAQSSLSEQVRERVRTNGIRNCALLTVAPTGTIGIVSNVSTGIEPLFAPLYWSGYYKSLPDGTREWVRELVITPEFEKYGDLVEGAYDISPAEHFQMQKVAQMHVDNSLSKTINLPREFSDGNLAKVWLEYLPYLKGTTVYKAGSRGDEPLEAIPISEAHKYIDKAVRVEFNAQEQAEYSCVNGVCDIPERVLAEVV